MGSKGKTPQDIRQANHELIFKLLRKNCAMSCTELAKETHLSNTAVEKITDNLYQKGFLVIHSETHPKVKGRRPIRYELNREACAYISFNFTDGVYCICDFCGNVLKTDSLIIEKNADSLVLKNEFNRIKAEAQKLGREIVSVSASLVGKADSKSGEIKASKLFKLGVNPIALLNDCFDVPSSLTNDTYLALISEIDQNKAENDKKQTDNAVYLYIGKGISCAFIISGKIFTGGSGLAGEIGMLPMQNDIVESALNYKELAKLDLQVANGSLESVQIALEPLLFTLAVTVKILDLSDAIISCPYPSLKNFIVERLNFKLNELNASNSYAYAAKSANISDGLNLYALSFCHNIVISRHLRQ